MTIVADRAYARTRTELEAFEIASFGALRSFVPNFFKDGRDNTVWGSILRSLAVEMGRSEYQTHYLLYGHNPAYLTPADVLRRYRGPLFINRNYPGITQYDLDFKTMVLKLIEAYRLGATTQSIQKVIEAYTGQVYEVEELFKSIGTFYDISDRHYIRVGVAVSQAQAGITTNIAADVARVRDLVKDLYVAIDLAKPAHVGIDLTTILGLDEEEVTPPIEDELRIFMVLEEEPPGDPMLWQAPFLDPNTPDTGLAPESITYTYQWFRNGVAIPGATGPDYVLADAGSPNDPEHPDEFQLRVSGWTAAQNPASTQKPEYGTIWSPVVYLTVVASTVQDQDLPKHKRSTPAPQPSSGSTLFFRIPPFGRTIRENGTVTFGSTVENHVKPGLVSPKLDVVWEIPGGDELFGLDFD